MGELKIKDQSWIDDGWLIQWKNQPSEGRLYAKRSQIDRHAILSRNAELRKSPGVLTDMSFGRYMLSIPLEDYQELKAKYPILVHGSNAERTAFYKRFIQTSESEPYRVQG